LQVSGFYQGFWSCYCWPQLTVARRHDFP
jgi:hypothetical protein